MSDTAETGMVVLLSGGLDSSVLLHHPRRQVGIETPVHALAIHYGQRHARELDAARYQADTDQAQDEYVYWDCIRELLQRIKAVLALNRKEPLQILAPFVHWIKAKTL